MTRSQNGLGTLKAHALIHSCQLIEMDPSCRKYCEERKKETLLFKSPKQRGASPASLAKVYTTVVRPALEYAAPVVKYSRFDIL